MLLFLGSCSSHAKPPLSSKDIQHLNLVNGGATECMMDTFFLYQSNWQKIEGERGVNGIDGLYIKQENDHIRAVLVAESKYNHARLGTTKKGSVKQMSKAWILQKLQDAKPHNPDVAHFYEIIDMVLHDVYRARLFHLKPLKGNKLKITLYDIKNRNDNRSIDKIKTGEITLDFQNPKNNFEADMIEAYNRCRREALERWFDKLTPNEIEALLQKSAIRREDI
jgi:hypothetical protein